MDASYELGSTTEVSADDLRSVNARHLRGALFDHYVRRDPAVDHALAASLGDFPTLEEQARVFSADHRALFTLALLFRAALKRLNTTNVPGHGTVSDIGVADGDLGIQSNLLVEGTLLVLGDLSVGGQLVMGEDATVIVIGSLHASAVTGFGQLSIGGDLRAMFVDVHDGALDVGGVLDTFLLIQRMHVTRASEFSVGLHAVLSEEVAATDVFLPTMLDADGRPDWTVVARAAQSAEDVFRPDYQTPRPAADTWVQPLR